MEKVRESLAGQAGVSAKTAQRYLRYLELSYQAISLPVWHRNEGKRLIKSPKLHFLDNGVLQAVLQKRGGMTGSEFESLVVAELYKQARCFAGDARHLRGLADFLDEPLLHSFILSNDPETKSISEDITALHAAYFLG